MQNKSHDSAASERITSKHDWAEPKAKWVKPELVQLKGHAVDGKASVFFSEFTNTFSYGPS